MGGKPEIRLGDEPLVETLLAAAGFVAGREKDAASLRIKGEGGAPYSIRRLEPQLLHIGMLRALERVRMRPSQLRAVIRQQLGGSKQRVLDTRLKGLELGLEGVIELDDPNYDIA